MTNENAKASARSTAACRFVDGNGRAALAGLAMLCAFGVVLGVGCDDPAQAGVGTGGATGAGLGGQGGQGGQSGQSGQSGQGGHDSNGGSGAVVGTCPDGTGLALGVASHENEGATHRVVCADVSYMTKPPSSGSHYGVWPVFKTYAQPVPWGFLVHGLEHGAVVVVYNCPGGCPDEVATAQAWIDALPTDANCGARPRVVLAPDPTLDVRWAATAWTWTLRACSFDQAMFQTFYDEHYDHGPEAVCGDNADYSATGWCP